MNQVILKTSDLFDDYLYPQERWKLPSWVAKNEDFLSVLRDVISNNLDESYISPSSFDALFRYFESKRYAIFQERFIVCLSQSRLAYLTHAGFSKVSATKELFILENWKVQV